MEASLEITSLVGLDDRVRQIVVYGEQNSDHYHRVWGADPANRTFVGAKSYHGYPDDPFEQPWPYQIRDFPNLLDAMDFAQS
jgi:hypothetical protein